MTTPTSEPLELIADALLDRLDEHLEHLVGSDAEHHRGAIAAISTALSQVRSGTYGTCLACARKIEHERLAHEPEASTCEQCQHHPRALIG
jgi:RNA polymerase-binding transcription factor DksA